MFSAGLFSAGRFFVAAGGDDASIVLVVARRAGAAHALRYLLVERDAAQEYGLAVEQDLRALSLNVAEAYFVGHAISVGGQLDAVQPRIVGRPAAQTLYFKLRAGLALCVGGERQGTFQLRNADFYFLSGHCLRQLRVYMDKVCAVFVKADEVVADVSFGQGDEHHVARYAAVVPPVERHCRDGILLPAVVHLHYEQVVAALDGVEGVFAFCQFLAGDGRRVVDFAGIGCLALVLGEFFLGHVDDEALPHADGHALVEVVPIAQVCEADAEFQGDGTGHVAFPDGVEEAGFALGAHVGGMHFDARTGVGGAVAVVEVAGAVVGEDGVLAVDEGADVVVGKLQGVGFAVACRDDVGTVLRVEVAQFFDGKVYLGGDLLKVEPVGNDKGVAEGREGGGHGGNPVLFVVAEGVVHGDEGGHVAPRFAWEVVVDVPVVALSAGAAYCLVDVAGTAVVGGNDEYPVAVDAVQVIEVLDGCLGGTDRVAAFVHEGVDFQLVHSAGGVHELP